MKDKIKAVYSYILKHCKIAFPVVLIVVVAVTVAVALGIRNGEDPKEPSGAILSGTEVSSEEPVQPSEAVSEEVPLVANEDGELYTLVATYCNAMAMGDTETLMGLFDVLPENNIYKIEEMSKYIDYYPALEVYTKAGLDQNATVVYVFYRIKFVNHEDEVPGYETLYVCRNEQGELYIKNEENFTEEEREYIKTVTTQDDVVEFNNRVTKEYNDLITENQDILKYLQELDNQVNIAVGVRVAQSEAENTQAPEDDGQSQEQDTQASEPSQETTPQETGPQYATATTTVNVRSSDSEQADKLGKVAGGETVEVQEVRVNGWTKVVYDGQDGYIKSEYLQLQESAAGAQVIGTVTATTNINVRAAASETADRLGVLAGGETADLLENADGWCKIKYDGGIAYVKADYVQVN